MDSMKRKDIIKYVIFVMGIVIIFLFASYQGRNIPESTNLVERGQQLENLGQSIIWMLFGWVGIFFGSIGIYNGFKKRAKKK